MQRWCDASVRTGGAVVASHVAFSRTNSSGRSGLAPEGAAARRRPGRHVGREVMPRGAGPVGNRCCSRTGLLVSRLIQPATPRASPRRCRSRRPQPAIRSMSPDLGPEACSEASDISSGDPVRAEARPLPATRKQRLAHPARRLPGYWPARRHLMRRAPVPNRRDEDSSHHQCTVRSELPGSGFATSADKQLPEWLHRSAGLPPWSMHDPA